MRLLVALLLSCCAMFAWAAPEDDAKKQMEKGAKAFSTGKYSDAVLAFSRALEILPDAAGPHRELGKCYQKLSEPERALNHYTQYLTRRPDAEERKTIEAVMIEIRDKLPTQGRALVSIEAFPGSVVYVISASGETQGIGVSPVLRHPVESRFTTMRLITKDNQIKEKVLQLSPSNEFRLGDADFGVSPTKPVKVLPLELPPTSKAGNKAVTPEVKDTEPKKSKAPLALFGVAGVSAVAAGVSGALFLTTTSEMQTKIDSLDSATPAEKTTTNNELASLEEKALITMRVAQIAGIAAVASAAGAVVLSAKSKKETKAALLLGPTQLGVSVSF